MNAKEIIDRLFREVPAFKKEVVTNSDLPSHSDLIDGDLYDNPYTAMGDFGLFMRDRIGQPAVESRDHDLTRSFGFIGEMLLSKEVNEDNRLFDLIYVGLLEILTDSPDIIKVAKRYLDGEALERFEYYVDKIMRSEPFFRKNGV